MRASDIAGFAMNRRAFVAVGAMGVAACMARPRIAAPHPPAAGLTIEQYDSRLARAIDPTLVPQVLGQGYEWTEGPTWDQKRQRLYFSEIPTNRVMMWDPATGIGELRNPGGSGTMAPGAAPGTNGLLYVKGEDALIVCDQDSRSVLKYRMGASGAPQVLARGGPGDSFNSPNDLVMASDGSIYFTDPPYGLKDGPTSPAKVRKVDGVYRIAPDGKVSLVDGTTPFPNGIGLSPDENTMYLGVSDTARPRIARLTRTAGGWKKDADVWVDGARFSQKGEPGSCDGMAIATDGTLFATVAGGVAIILPDGTVLGRIQTKRATGNCTFGEDGSTLFITADDVVLRIPTRLRGMGF